MRTVHLDLPDELVQELINSLRFRLAQKKLHQYWRKHFRCHPMILTFHPAVVRIG